MTGSQVAWAVDVHICSGVDCSLSNNLKESIRWVGYGLHLYLGKYPQQAAGHRRAEQDRNGFQQFD